jgi:hypothetical protein
MTGLVAAVLMMCTSGGQCEQHSLYIEPRACGYHVKAYRADYGAGTISVKCK